MNSAASVPRRPRGSASSTVVVLLGLAAVAGWWFLKSSKPGPQPAAQAPEQVIPQEAPRRTGPAPGAAPPAVEEIAVAPPTQAPATESGPVVAAVPSRPGPADFSRLLVLDAMGAAKKENLTWSDEAWQLAKTTGQWDGYRDLLARSLQVLGQSPADLGPIVTGKYSGPALIRHAFLTAVPEAVLKPLRAKEPTGDFLDWLLETPVAMQAFTGQLLPKDSVEKALTVWATMAAENPDAKTDYRELAIACAVVFDRTIKVDQDRYAKAVNPVERYTHFRNNSEAGRLIGKIKKMSATELAWVVGVPISQAELDWAVKKTNFRQQSWGAAYSSIQYDMAKAVNNKGSYEAYTFAEIQKKGGICADQSYFGAWTACAHGVPASTVSGDGAQGPHAWMTWLADEGEWKFAGRFAGYPAGRCRSPQTGESISEEEFLRLSDRKNSSPAQVLKARQSLWLATVCASAPDRAFLFLTEAVRYAPRLTGPAAALLTHWMTHRADAKIEEWTALLKDLRKNFQEVPTLMAATNKAEEQFVFARRDAPSNMKNLRRDNRKTGDASKEEAGVAIDVKRLSASLRREAELLRTAMNNDGIRSLYKRALSEHGDNPATFKTLAKDYFSYFKTDPATAAKVCRELESTCRRSIGRGQGDFFDIVGQNSAWMVVSDCYRTAGDAGKADSIKKDCESRAKMSKKQAL